MPPVQAPRPAHARMPRFALWMQDNILLFLLMLASGYVNGVMLVDGWVPNIEDWHTWGVFHGIGVPLLFAAGFAMGGLTLRVSYKLSECILRRQWGRSVFLSLGIVVLAAIEFWSSFSQRAPNLHPTAADALLPLPALPFSIAAILIALVVPFASLLWGFAADDPTPAPVEDPATLQARLENERIKAAHAAEMQRMKAAGWRGAIDALKAPGVAAMQADAPDVQKVATEPFPTGEYPAVQTSARRRPSGPKAKPLPNSKDYPAYIEEQRRILASQDKPADAQSLADATGERVEDIQAALRTWRAQQAAERPAGRSRR